MLDGTRPLRIITSGLVILKQVSQNTRRTVSIRLQFGTYSFNPTTVWNNATPNSQTRTLSPVKETKYMAFSFDDISTNPSTGQGTAGPGVAEIKIWGYPSSTVSY